MKTKTLEFTINGRNVALDEKPGEMLSDLIRYRLGLTGTKIGCNEAECGSCTVLIDGEPVLSCSYPAAKVRGRTVVTIEGLAGQVEAAPPAGRIREVWCRTVRLLHTRPAHDLLCAPAAKSRSER